MNEQPQPHLEILSRNRVNRSTIIVAAIPVSIFSGMVAYGLLRFLAYISIGVLVLLTIGALWAICGLVYLAARWYIDLRARYFRSMYVYLHEHGLIDATSGTVYPHALPAPMPDAVPAKPDRAQQIMFRVAQGDSYRTIAKELGTTKYDVEKTVREHTDV